MSKSLLPKRSASRPSPVILISLAVLIVGVAGWYVWQGNWSLVSRIEGKKLVIARQNPLHQPNYPALKPVTLTDGAAINAIATDINHLATFPAGEINCPADDGVTYTLRFNNGMTAEIDASGCQGVTVTQGHMKSVYWMAQPNRYSEDLQNRLQKAIHQQLRYDF